MSSSKDRTIMAQAIRTLSREVKIMYLATRTISKEIVMLLMEMRMTLKEIRMNFMGMKIESLEREILLWDMGMLWLVEEMKLILCLNKLKEELQKRWSKGLKIASKSTSLSDCIHHMNKTKTIFFTFLFKFYWTINP